MRIVIDMDFDDKGNKIAEHVIHTEAAPWNVSTHPDGISGLKDPLTILVALKGNAALANSSGWSAITKHPNYPGKTRLQVLLAEIVRLNDGPARIALGV